MDKDFIIKNSVPEPNTGCWLWSRSTDSKGYGQIMRRPKNLRAHRISFSAFKNDPGKFHVLHKCDTPSCVNPDHLFLGTQKDNMKDCFKKGRGSQPPLNKAKLSKNDVLFIRNSKLPQFKLAKMFGVTNGTISSCISLRTWRNL